MVARRGVFLDELFQNQEAQALTLWPLKGLLLA
jgi:hypothetical protein